MLYWSCMRKPSNDNISQVSMALDRKEWVKFKTHCAAREIPMSHQMNKLVFLQNKEWDREKK